MHNYDLGEMKMAEGQCLAYELEAKGTEYAMRILELVEMSPAYKELYGMFNSERVRLYFLRAIKREILPFAKKGFVIQWYKLHNKALRDEDAVVRVPSAGIFSLLQSVWDLGEAPLKAVNRSAESLLYEHRYGARLKTHMKKRIRAAMLYFEDLWTDSSPEAIPSDGMVACHYNEGVNTARRSDLHWYSASGIEARRIIIYFDDLSVALTHGKSIEKSILRTLDEKGFKWVVLKKGVVENGDGRLWVAPPFKKRPSNARRILSVPDRWIVDTGNALSVEVHYWRSFHKAFNVKVHFITEEGFSRNIAQAIAFDMEGEEGGLLVGRQRSEIFLPCTYMAGMHSKDIFFIWNERTAEYFRPNFNMIRQAVISGYQLDVFQRFRGFSIDLRAGGAKFIIALFDSSHGRELAYSTKAMSSFCKTFLNWVLEDDTFGLVIKPKKPRFFNALPPEIHVLYERARRTGRCIKVEDSFGMMPAEAAVGTDMVVGIGGISTAAIESVIAGLRGILYDITNIKYHEFYKFGYERLIFDDLVKMVEAIKRYKEDPQSEPSLGDWSEHVKELCPFRDGKGGDRMGVYMRWLLDSFDRGLGRSEAIKDVNNRYAAIWGSDKTIDLNSACEDNRVASYA